MDDIILKPEYMIPIGKRQTFPKVPHNTPVGPLRSTSLQEATPVDFYTETNDDYHTNFEEDMKNYMLNQEYISSESTMGEFPRRHYLSESSISEEIQERLYSEEEFKESNISLYKYLKSILNDDIIYPEYIFAEIKKLMKRNSNESDIPILNKCVDMLYDMARNNPDSEKELLSMKDYIRKKMDS